MFRSHCSRLRTSLGELGLVTASASPEASGRLEDACIRPARLLEADAPAGRPVGTAVPLGEPLAFVDGVQRSETVAYAGSSPLVVAEVAAAVRLRDGRTLRTVEEERLLFVAGRADALALASPALAAMEVLVVDDPGPQHPLRDLDLVRRLVDRVRGNLELAVYDRFRQRHDSWLVVDGSLTVSPRLAADPRVVGLSKSHSALPFEGEALDHYLRLAPGARSSMFMPAGEHAPVVAWALRLWPFEGRDLLHGLVRVEVAPALGIPSVADRISRWILAERSPISADGRWDRLLYGIHSVEQYLKSGAR